MLMAEGLFDGRYRYDYIYPRGRSGETLRAYDTRNDDRPVVIKRPAPNDAPPIRGGQEVSILNERDALKRLAGHPVLTELLDEGHFMVGGTSHRYVVMERGEGEIVEEMVLARAKANERLPLLETLVIVDNLLDLLGAAHERDIVYNDVDAKHLFWNRDTYLLKVIDWGNAVFLEGEQASPQGVSKQADVYQTGELLYFVLTGGGRADIPRDADAAFIVDFGEDAERVPPELARVVSGALHPNPRLRYASVPELRRELAKARRPLEGERNAILSRVNERLRRTLSRDELHDLRRTLQPALDMDPGYPASHEARAEIDGRLNDLQIASDLDAAKIYLASMNWRGAADILGELKGSARGTMQQVARLLFDWTMLLLEFEDDGVQATPTVVDAIGLVFDGKWALAAKRLVLADAPDAAANRVHMRLAERITSHMPDVVLLRPNLFRLGEALGALDGTEGVSLTEQRELMDEIGAMMDIPPGDAPVSLIDLRDTYRGVVDRLTAMTTLMEAVNIGWGERRLPLSSLERARLAAMALADNMHVIGKQAAQTPREALAALDSSRDIDPTNPAWDAVGDMLNNLYRLLESYQTYVPMADASDLAVWLRRAQTQLAPFVERLFDDMLAGMVAGLKTAEEQWETLDNLCVAGNRVGALKALNTAAGAVGTVSPTLSGWFNQLRSVINSADYIERHALSGGLGRALADGWAAFDKGLLTDAERLAAQADQIAKTDLQTFVVSRFKTLVETMRGWVERNGYLSASRTEKALETVSELYTEEENLVRERFNKQMPTPDTYLKAMGKGIVEIYAVHSSAAQRILFADYVLQGAIDAHDGAFTDAEFWVAAAERALEPRTRDHVALQTLRNLIQRRKDLLQAQQAFNQFGGVDDIAALPEMREQFEQHPQAKPLGEAVRSLREIENALPDWANAEFRTAGMKLENALKAAQEAEKIADIDLSDYRGWVADLQAVAANLHTAKRDLADIVEDKPDVPTDELARLHDMLPDETKRTVGAEYAATLDIWRDTYHAFAAVINDASARRSAKLDAMNDLFRAMFIDRHPAYPLYRHWYDLTERAPEFPAPPTEDPQPRLTEDDDAAPAFEDESPADDDAPALMPEADADSTPPRSRRRGGMNRTVIVLVVAAVLAAGGLVVSNFIGGDDTPALAVTISATPTEAVVAAVNITEEPSPATTDTETATEEATVGTPPAVSGSTTDEPSPAATENVTDEPSPAATDTETAPSHTPTPADTATPTETFTPSHTPTETDTATPTVTPTITNTPTPAVPVGGLNGEVDLLNIARRLPRENESAVFWEPERFSPEPDYWRMGIGAETADETYVLLPPPEIVTEYLGATAPERVTVLEAEIALATFNPALLDGDGVYFGVLLVPLESTDPLQDGAGLHIDVVQAGIFNMGTREQGDVDIAVQRAVNAPIVRIRLERTPDGAVQVSINGDNIGVPVRPVGSADPSVPVLPALYVTDGGVILSVTEWTLTLR